MMRRTPWAFTSALAVGSNGNASRPSSLATVRLFDYRARSTSSSILGTKVIIDRSKQALLHNAHNVKVFSRSGLMHRACGGVMPTASAATALMARRFYMPASPKLKEDSLSDEPKPVTVKEAVRCTLPYLWPKGRWDHRARVATALGFVVLSKASLVAVPLAFKCVVDSLVAPTAATAAGPVAVSVFALVAAYGVARLVAAFTSEMRTALFAKVSADAYTSLHERILLKLMGMDLNYHLSRKTGALTRVLDRGSRAFTNLSFLLLFILVPTGIEMTLVCGMLQNQAGFSFVATAVVAVGTYVGFTFWLTNIRNGYRDQYNEREAKASAMVVDSLINFETVKYFGKETVEAKRLRTANEEMNVYVVRLEQSLAALNFGQQAIFIMAAVASLYLSTSGVIAGAMTVGDLVLVDALLLQLYAPLSMLGIVYRELVASTQNMQQMVGLLQAPIRIVDAPTAKLMDWTPSAVAPKGAITIRDVTFSYPNHNRVVIDKISLHIPAGSSVAFVGHSGCGKSSLFRLLFRFYDPQEGTIEIDGVDVKDMALSSLRAGIAVVPQDCVMFNGTVRYNVEYGYCAVDGSRPSEESVVEATKAAQVHDTIRGFEKQYDTEVGERGLKLSGGEKQRVAIARALLKDAPILLCDEATSALDNSTEARVIEALRRRPGGHRRTVVFIAHRLTTVQHCDTIFVFDKGHIAEKGTHKDLLSLGGIYATMWHQQQRAGVTSPTGASAPSTGKPVSEVGGTSTP